MDRRQFIASGSAALVASPVIANTTGSTPLPAASVSEFLEAEAAEVQMTVAELRTFRKLCPIDYGVAWETLPDGTRRCFSLSRDPEREAQIEAFWESILARWRAAKPA